MQDPEGHLVGYAYTIPIPTAVWVILAVIAVVLIIVLLLIALPVMKFTIVVSGDSIYVSAPPLAKVRVRKEDVIYIHEVRLSDYPGLRPTIRTFGLGLPGCKIGWFRLANGARAFLGLTWSDRAVVMELRDGTYVILTPKNLSEFITTLRNLGWLK